ncbi:uncharacterized protein LOC126765576 [Bactrocera neohumeralis]|uniref:uncharacterized protein LOC126765576 n=1 Tax=Bactrocera neohumeralis TaxID=98809 RepID=UPI00216683F8|nr:uncharacterized protein LOC126765576 [Bactrocera neohumeralis]
MVELLQQKPKMAQGFTKCPKEEVAAFWNNMAQELNSVGPPIKDISSSKKVWLDWKAYIKRKLVENKKEQSATGGGRYRQHHFNELEEAVIALTALQTSASGIDNTVSIGLPIVADVGNETLADVSMPSVTCSPALPKRTTRPPETCTADVIKEQFQIQKDFQEKVIEKLDDLSVRMRRVGRALEVQNDLKNAEVEEIRRHNIAMENLIAAKNSIKQRMLEIEEKKLQAMTKNN